MEILLHNHTALGKYEQAVSRLRSPSVPVHYMALTDAVFNAQNVKRLPECSLTGEEKPELSSHVFRNALEDQLLGFFSTVHAHSLSILGEVVLPCLLLQKLLSLSKDRYIFMRSLYGQYTFLRTHPCCN